MGNGLAISYKHIFPHDPVISLLGIYSKLSENICVSVSKLVYDYLFLITKPGNNSRFIICGMDKLWCSHTLGNYSVMKGQITDMCNDVIDLKCSMLRRG